MYFDFFGKKLPYNINALGNIPGKPVQLGDNKGIATLQLTDQLLKLRAFRCRPGKLLCYYSITLRLLQ